MGRYTMRIGVDIDNVISKFNEKLLEEYLKHDKELGNIGIVNKDADNLRRMFGWPKDEEENFYYSNIERMARNFDIVENASQFIKKIRSEGHEIYIISGRDNGEYSDPNSLTIEWLDKFDVEYDKLILTNAYDDHQKTKICIDNNVSIMIDDSSRVCLDADKYGLDTLIMDTPFNRKTDSITRVHNWQEIYNYIKNYQENNINN